MEDIRLSCSLRAAAILTSVVLALATLATAQSKATLDVSETLFSVDAAMNVCGYDQELQSSSPLRAQVRADLVEAAKNPAVAEAASQMCAFYADHRQEDASHELAQYVSLALSLNDPPSFAPKAKESDLPPDSTYVLGFVPLLKQYYAAANLHGIWMKYQPQYLALIDRYHEPVAHMIYSNDTYLRLPMTTYANRSFTIYLEPMIAPGQVNSRNYSQDYYYLVISPQGDNLHMQELRHTYLHYALDPLIARRATALARLKPVLVALKRAPMDDDYKEDAGLLVIECLIRAIEARNPLNAKLPEQERLDMVRRDQAEGFILTGYFYEKLRAFEKESRGLQDAFSEWLHTMDVAGERKKATETQFVAAVTPDVVRTTKAAPLSRLDLADNELAAGNPAGAQKLVEAVLSSKTEDQGRAYFILARVAIFGGDMEGAQQNFQKALQNTKDPHLLAWSHIYLGRILDMQDERDAAVAQYSAALNSGDPSPDTKKAADEGVKTPFQPKAPSHEQN